VQTLNRFFQSLEGRRGAAAVREEWRQLCGEELPALEKLLRPTGELSLAYPHDDPDYYYYRVVTHGPDDHVGVCDETGKQVVLTTEQLIIHELDPILFYPGLADALGFTLAPAPIEGLYQVHRLGHYTPLAGYRFPVVLVIALRHEDLLQAIDYLTAAEDAPFLVLAPTRQLLKPAGEARLRRRKAGFLALDESVAVDGGRLVPLPGAKEAVDAFLRQHLPAPEKMADGTFFPTPAGTAWSNVRIHLTDGHTASITAGTARAIYTYAQMGMANRKNGNPSKQWELLREMANGQGILTWGSPGADRRNQKRRELLARCLMRFFRIEGDPIVCCGNGWRTRFQIGGLV
jgi:hypothetical protein